MNLDFGRPERDYLGRKLCNPCWNGHHWHRAVKADGGRGTEIVIDCEGGSCECDCRAVLADKITKRPKRDMSNQLKIDVGSIEVGPLEHRDEG